MDREHNHTVIDGVHFKDHFEDKGEHGHHHHHRHHDHEAHEGHDKKHYYELAHVSVKGGKAIEGEYVPFSLHVDKPNDLPIKVTLADAFGKGKHPATLGEDFKDKYFVYDHETKDYVKAKGDMVVIPPNESKVDFYVKTKDDYEIEPKEKFAVKIEWVKYLYNDKYLPDPKFDPYEEAVGRIIDNDCATVSIEGGKGKEGDYIPFTLSVDKPNDLDIKVTLEDAYAKGKHPAYPGEDFKQKYFVHDHESNEYVVAKKNMVTIPGGEESVTFYVKTKDDYYVEPKEKFSVQIKKVKYIDNEYKLNEPKFDPYEIANGVIRDDDRAHISIEGSKAVEGEYLPFVLYVDQPVELPIKVTLKDPKGIGDHPATPGKDFKNKYFTLDYETNEFVPVKNNMVVIPEYQFATIVFVKTKDDNKIEPQEKLSVKIEGAEYLYNNYGFKDPTFQKKGKAVGVIKDNDCATVVVKGGLAEEGEFIPFRLHVDKPIKLDIKVTLSEAFGIDEHPAKPGEDFGPKYFVFDHYTKEYVKAEGNMIVIPANEKWVDFYVKTKEDYDKEYKDETFGVKIEDVKYIDNEYKFLEPKFDPHRAVGMIRDDDHYKHHDHDHDHHHGKGGHDKHDHDKHGRDDKHDHDKHGRDDKHDHDKHHGKGEHHNGDDDGYSVHYHYYYGSEHDHEHGKDFDKEHKDDGRDHSVHYHYYYGPYSEHEHPDHKHHNQDNHEHGGHYGDKHDKHGGGDKHDDNHGKDSYYNQYYNYDNDQYYDDKQKFDPNKDYGFDHYGYDLEPHFDKYGYDDPNFWSYQREQHHSFKDAWVKYQITHGDYDYRHIDGSDNNKYDHEKGSAGIHLLRKVPADYLEDGYTPAADETRPSAREISNEIFTQVESTPNGEHASAMFWLWGQFVDHDIDLTTDSSGEHYDIKIPEGDVYFDPNGDGDKTMSFIRSEYDDKTGHDGVPREQVNSITSYLDASMVYGSDHERASYLRTYQDGKMKTSEYDLLPYNEAGLPNAGGNDDSFFIAGDVRANENIGLTAMHTLWVREHNHWCDKVKSWYPDMGDEEIYQRAKMMVECEIQHITYNEYLPLLLGKDAMPEYHGYDHDVTPDVASVFSAAAYRLGHSMVSSTIFRLDENGEPIEAGNLALRDAFFTPHTLADQHEIASILRGFAGSKSEAIDSQVIDELRNFLFGEPGSGGFDLVSLNIQRGRDHGLPDYNTCREAYGLPKLTSFSEITSDAAVAAKLEALYGDIDNVDLWVAGLCEDTYGDSMLGETFHTIVTDQFVRMRDGDRHWYEDRLPDDVLHMVKHTTLSDVIVRNTDVEYMQSDSMINYDRIYGTDGKDDLHGDQYHDLIMALKGSDLIEGYGGNDQIHGGKGKDNIHGGEGHDVMHGNGGKDVFVFHKHSGHDVIKDFKPGTDKIDVKEYHLTEADLFLETYKDGKDTVVVLSPDSKITLENISPIELQYTDFIV